MAGRPRRSAHIEIDDLTGQVSEVYENALEQGAAAMRAALDEIDRATADRSFRRLHRRLPG